MFTCCTTICLRFALSFVYILYYRWFTFCTTVCLPFALPSVYLLYYFLFTFCTTVRRTTAVSGVHRITFRAKTCRASVCRHSASRPNEFPSAVVRLSIEFCCNGGRKCCSRRSSCVALQWRTRERCNGRELRCVAVEDERTLQLKFDT